MSKGGGRRRSRGRGGVVYKFNEKERTTRIAMNLKGEDRKKKNAQNKDLVPLRESSLLTSRQRLVFLCTGHQLYNCLYVTWTESDHVTADSPERQAWDKVTAPISFDPPSATVPPFGRCIIDRPEILAGFMGPSKPRRQMGGVMSRLFFFHISVCDEWTWKTNYFQIVLILSCV
jgi:hypothetical protein